MTNYYSGNTTLVLISAERASLPAVANNMRTGELRKELEYLKLDFGIVVGHWKGTEETTFLVEVPVGNVELVVHTLAVKATKYGQDAILVVNPDRSTYLVNTSPNETTEGSTYSEVYLKGRMKPVNSVEGLDAYTRTLDGNYYVVG